MDAAVFLDRDNTIIRNDGDLGDPEQVELMQGAASAIASLCGLGFKIVVVTNQGGVARGKYREQDVEAVNERVRAVVAATCTGARIDRFYFCPYHPEATVSRYRQEHPWRKPQPGMLLAAAADMNLDLSRSWMIGDQMRDIEAGQAAGVRTILLSEDPSALKLTLASPDDPPDKVRPRYVARSLVEAVRIVAQKRNALDEALAQPLAEPAPTRKWDAAAVAALQRRVAVTQPASSATVDSEASPPEDKKRPRPATAKPFRPWTAPPVEARQPGDEVEPSADRPEPDSTTPRADAEPEPGESDAEPTPASAAPGSTAPVAVLRQILQELRSLRGSQGEFSQLSIIVMVMLAVAGVCYVAALMLGGADPLLFAKLTATTIVILLACIVVLLLTRR